MFVLLNYDQIMGTVVATGVKVTTKAVGVIADVAVVEWLHQGIPVPIGSEQQ